MLVKFKPFLIFALLLNNCSSKAERYGHLSFHNTADKNSFIFSVNEEFLSSNSASPKDKKNPKMSKAEAALLTKLLEQKNYCLNNHGAANFTITSRQEKIYDMTFAHLIEQNYNIRPITPRMYFGRCLEK